jgi:hypothetical protein
VTVRGWLLRRLADGASKWDLDAAGLARRCLKNPVRPYPCCKVGGHDGECEHPMDPVQQCGHPFGARRSDELSSWCSWCASGIPRLWGKPLAPPVNPSHNAG